MEVEALRESMLRLDEEARRSQPGGDCEAARLDLIQTRRKSAYQKAYVDTAYVTHNNSGPSGGLDKLLTKFYPPTSDEAGRTWREFLLLERLGFSREEIAEYKKAAEDAEMFT